MAIKTFDEQYYLQNNSDVLVAVSQGVFASGLAHYLAFGAKELRNPNAYFDAKYYAAHNPDVVAAVNAGIFSSVLEHYELYGEKEGRPFAEGQVFNETAYLAANPDVAAAVSSGAFLSGYEHFVQYGAEEGRSGSGVVATGFALTNGTDVLTGNLFTAGLVYTPGGDDRINALQDEDILTGVGTNPTLTASLGNANDNGDTIITPTLTNIQTLNVAFTGSGDDAVTALDLQDSSGLTAVNISRISQAVNQAEIGNITSANVGTLEVHNTNANQAGTVEFSFAAGVLKGANTGSVVVDNVQIGALNIGQNTSGIEGTGVGTNGYENLTITSTGAATNTISTLNVPMDTGTDGKIVLEGDAALVLANTANITGAAGVEAVIHGGGIAQAQGRLATVDASAMTGALTLNVGNGLLSTGKADTSGVVQDVTITGTQADDTFYLNDLVQAGDKIVGGGGSDTLVAYQGGVLGTVSGVENLSVQMEGINNLLSAPPAIVANGSVTLDMDKLPDVTLSAIRNISHSTLNGVGDLLTNNQTATLNNLSATQAAGLHIQHSTTTNGGIDDTKIVANLKVATGASDLIAVSIDEGVNTDPRFNFTLDSRNSDGVAQAVESVTLTDNDSESNSVALNDFAKHTGTITLKGGLVGTFLNLDVSTTNTDSAVPEGIYGLAADGSSADFVAGNATSHGYVLAPVANQVRLVAATVDASAEVGNVIVRLDTNTAAGSNGGQTVTMGSGDDTVIFDKLNDSRAGLTISDKVVGGAGNDTLVIDGDGVRVSLGASEWTNVSGFETLRLAGNAQLAAGNTFLGNNAYNLTLTNDLITTNGSGLLKIVNDNDAGNDVADIGNTLGTAGESGVTIDARSLDAQHHFSYNGEEGTSATADRFIFADANVNGGNVIDGGAQDNSATTVFANADVMEVRNTATVTAGDLAGLSNIGTIAGVSDQAVTQTLDLELTNGIIDTLVDSYHTAKVGEVETLTVRLNNAADTASVVSAMALKLDASSLSNTVAVNVSLATSTATVASASDSLQLSPSGGVVTAANFVTTAAAGALNPADKLVLSLSDFTLGASAAGGSLDATDFTSSAALVDSATSVAANEIVFDQTNGNVFYNTDGAAAGGLVLIGTLAGVNNLAITDFSIIA